MKKYNMNDILRGTSTPAMPPRIGRNSMKGFVALLRIPVVASVGSASTILRGMPLKLRAFLIG